MKNYKILFLEDNKNLTGTCTNKVLPEMTLEAIKEAAAKLVKIPPYPIKAECSKDTFNHLKISFAKSDNVIKEHNLGGLQGGLSIYFNEEIKIGDLEIEFSDKTKKIIKLF